MWCIRLIREQKISGSRTRSISKASTKKSSGKQSQYSNKTK